ncbi:hypothetical protein GCM10010109_89260 [Actinoplanes campanulatus]|nr:hypothetical protein GCM10010109_89260 [Actinoplanes campanulatus]GID42476.1 hypothetical protein Aca09nite_89820 [Actinoplanes campanulatus]
MWVVALVCAGVAVPSTAHADNAIVQTVYTVDPAPLVHNGRVHPVKNRSTGRMAIGVGVAGSPTGPFTDALGRRTGRLRRQRCGLHRNDHALVAAFVVALALGAGRLVHPPIELPLDVHGRAGRTPVRVGVAEGLHQRRP